MVEYLDIEEVESNSTVEELKEAHHGSRTATASYGANPFIILTSNFIFNRRLEIFAQLLDNWDNDGAKAPSIEGLNAAKTMIHIFSATGQSIYNIAPGPNGEILVDVRSKNMSKSIEFIFYPDKQRQVKFDSNGTATQEPFSFENLPAAMSWLNS
jgi:hypothetical protein